MHTGNTFVILEVDNIGFYNDTCTSTACLATLCVPLFFLFIFFKNWQAFSVK